MTQADFEYGTAMADKPVPTRVSVYGGEGFWREETLEDLRAVGCRTHDGGDLSALVDGPVASLGDVVVVECLGLPSNEVGSLVRLNDRIAASGADLVVLTSLSALDAIFSIFDRSSPQILVDPTRAELLIAVGRVMPGVPNRRLQEINERDRSTLLRLAEQVDTIARELDRISGLDTNGAEKLSDFKRDFRPASAEPLTFARPANTAASPALPDPKLVRQMIAGRQARARFFDGELFADPAWDMLLDLTAAHAEEAKVSVTSLCIAAGVPATTALRWLKQMVECGIFERVADETDRRRAFIELSEESRNAMARYFQMVDTPLARAA
ncbi:MAG: MarR family transcriptional regulator [Erythrobacter sp.]|uniref:MarR family transcriptional regulator n=1 Tax=Erythrobacter sp. TaxID=1042 RepID=UPI002635CADA|nr:MarR family transcriptional regulator [Erythrobacter sp.]MDJ0976922.1 MarR family transcriptional regulator [Erythrobacter sp.]